MHLFQPYLFLHLILIISLSIPTTIISEDTTEEEILVIPTIDERTGDLVSSEEFCFGRIPLVCKYEIVKTDTATPLPGDVAASLKKVRSTPSLSTKQMKILLEHAYNKAPKHPEVLYQYATFLEKQQEHILSNHLYLLAFHHSNNEDNNSLNGYYRTLPYVNEEKQKIFKRIEWKAKQLYNFKKESSLPFRRAQQEMHYKHIYHTNALEGNTISLLSTRYLLETKRVDGVRGSVQEVMEVMGMNDAIDFVLDSVDRYHQLSIDTKTIIDIHNAILRRVEPSWAGIYRDVNVVVADHKAPPHQLVPSMMDEFQTWLQSEKYLNMHPIERAALAHFQCGCILL